MNQSKVHLFDLPDEILLFILKKLDKTDVLYSLLDVNNHRLDALAQDRQFTNALNLVLTDWRILDRFCNDILPRIHRNVEHVILEAPSMQRILLAGNYPKLSQLKLYKFSQGTVLQSLRSKFLWPSSLTSRLDHLADSRFAHIFKQQITDLILVFNENEAFVAVLKDYTVDIYAPILTLFENLQHLSIHGSSIAAYPGLSLCDLPAHTFSSSVLTKLCVNVSTFDDCLYLLDGRLTQSTIFIVRIYDIDTSSTIIHNAVGWYLLPFLSPSKFQT